jgi:ribosomal protein S18 acetylase RimI-like enzyme
VEIRRIGADEWDELRDLRLRALQDAPDAFGSTYEEESARSDAEWMEWTADLADGGSSFGAVAVDDGDWVAMAVGAPHRDHAGEAGLFAMWVAPDARRSGVGRDLVRRVVAWARSQHFPVLRLLVTQTNDAAIHLYERCGFTDEGVRLPLRAGSDVTTMSMTLDPRGATAQSMG